MRQFICSSVLLATLLVMPVSGNPPTTQQSETAPPASQPVADSIDIRDYCTVVLAIKLQNHLHTTADQQANLADLKTKLYAYLDNAAGNIHVVRATPGLIAARGETVLNMIGKKVRDELTPEQRATLAGMFDDKTLSPIKVSAAVQTGRDIRGGMAMNTGISLDYTHYGEKDGAPAPVASPPTTSPVTANSAGPSPGRLRRRPQIDVQHAIKDLQADSEAIQTAAALRLSQATPGAQFRPAVLDALRPFVKDSADDQWASFVVPFCIWADAGEIDLIKSLLSTSDGLTRLDQKQKSASAICVALLRLDKSSAVDAINTRISDQVFRTHLIHDLNQLAKTDDDSKPIADSVVEQLMHYQAGTQITVAPPPGSEQKAPSPKPAATPAFDRT